MFSLDGHYLFLIIYTEMIHNLPKVTQLQNSYDKMIKADICAPNF